MWINIINYIIFRNIILKPAALEGEWQQKVVPNAVHKYWQLQLLLLLLLLLTSKCTPITLRY
jgi:sensor domain CHASE-containing protein